MKLNLKFNKCFIIFFLAIILVTLMFPVKEPLDVQRKDIPKGREDLYILKSEIVPPVCPKCPDSKVCPRQKPCPACPPCERCPEPSFTCKKVPNYKEVDENNDVLPLPVLNSFSAF